MKRVGFLLKVKADRLEKYKEYHRNVWPEQLEALRRTGWHNYTLFLRDDGLLIGYVEVPDTFEAALAGAAKEEANLKWQEAMKPYFELLKGNRPDQSMLVLEEIFHLD
jgi:L-rhamnose mutarotase